MLTKKIKPTTVPQLCHSRESGNPGILVRSLISHLLDTRFGFGFLRRSTSCVHAVVRGYDAFLYLKSHVHVCSGAMLIPDE